MRLAAWLTLLGLAALSLPASARAAACAAPDVARTGLSAALKNAILHDNRLEIVALGSSSTEGVGASSTASAYPAQLEALLRGRLAGRRVEVLNRGLRGETVADNLARLERDVLASAPGIVIWQVGTNDALRGLPLELVRGQLMAGIGRMQALGVQVVLMDPQALPMPEQERAVAAMSRVIAEVAERTGAALFSRHRLMQLWTSSGAVAPAALLGKDGLHMTDASYRCLAEGMAGFLLDPAKPSPAMPQAGRQPPIVTAAFGR